MKQCQFIFFLSFFVLGISEIHSQKVINVAYPAEGEIELAEGISIPKIEPGYTLWLPEIGKPAGMIVFPHSRREQVRTEAIIRYALKNQLAVIYVTTDNRLEFLFEEKKIKEIADYVSTACAQFDIPSDNLMYCGMSLAGTRAMKLAIFTKQEKDYGHIIPKAIAICDAPLDMVRVYNSSKLAVELNFEPISANEGKWVSEYLETNIGTPENSLASYNYFSPYRRSVRNGGNTSYFRDIHVRAYTEPDVNWWIENRRKDYYGMNAYDLAGFINQLLILESDKASLITTSNKGKQPDGTRQFHSWNIVDEMELVNWFRNL